MLGALAGVFPDLAIADDEIVHVFTGVRPLPASEDEATGRISRDHQVNVEPAGPLPFPVLTLIGGKWTTFRAFGEEVAEVALSELGVERTVDTSGLAIGGGRGFPGEPAKRAAWVQEQARASSLPEARFALLAQRYGSRAVEVARFMGDGDGCAAGFARRIFRDARCCSSSSMSACAVSTIFCFGAPCWALKAVSRQSWSQSQPR